MPETYIPPIDTTSADFLLGKTTPGSYAYNPNIPVDRITPAVPLEIPELPPETDLAGGMVAGAEASILAYDKLADATTDAEDTKIDTLNTEADALGNELTGRGAAQLAEEEKQGIAAKKVAVANINAQILSRTAEYNKLAATSEGKAITMNSIIGEQAQIKKAQASEIGLLNATSLGMQGQLDAAQDLADRAVDLKYSDKEAQYNAKVAQLERLEGKLDKKEKKRKDAMALYLQDKKDELAVERANEKDKNATLLNQMQKYPDAGITLNDTIESANKKITTKSKIYAQDTRLADGDGDSTTSSGFSTAKIETDVRENAFLNLKDVKGGKMTLEEAYDDMRLLYSPREVTDKALKDLLGIVPKETTTPSIPQSNEPVPTEVTGDTTGAIGSINRIGAGISNWFKGL